MVYEVLQTGVKCQYTVQVKAMKVTCTCSEHCILKKFDTLFSEFAELLSIKDNIFSAESTYFRFIYINDFILKWRWKLLYTMLNLTRLQTSEICMCKLHNNNKMTNTGPLYFPKKCILYALFYNYWFSLSI